MLVNLPTPFWLTVTLGPLKLLTILTTITSCCYLACFGLFKPVFGLGTVLQSSELATSGASYASFFFICDMYAYSSARAAK